MSRPADALSPALAATELAAQVRARALELGFQAVGFAPAAHPPTADFARYESFLRRGMHGDMEYLATHAAARRRVDGPEIMPGAATVVSVALRYGRSNDQEQAAPPLARLLARYARGRDYHGVVRKRLRKLAAFVRGLAPGVAARGLCDTAPLLERAWAARAGLGAVGKNGLLIVPGQGSYVVLGEVVTTLKLVGEPLQPTVDPCGECSLCLAACPTGALCAPYVLDPRRCISYATIESRAGPLPPLAAALSDQLFGCDHCQQVCPHNRLPPESDDLTEPFHPLERWRGLELGRLLQLTAAEWDALRRGTALGRLSHERLLGNALSLLAARSQRGDIEAARLLAAAAEGPEGAARRLARELWAAVPGPSALDRSTGPREGNADSD